MPALKREKIQENKTKKESHKEKNKKEQRKYQALFWNTSHLTVSFKTKFL